MSRFLTSKVPALLLAFVIVTFASGTSAPVGSLTSTRSVPERLCAQLPKESDRTNTEAIKTKPDILVPTCDVTDRCATLRCFGSRLELIWNLLRERVFVCPMGDTQGAAFSSGPTQVW